MERIAIITGNLGQDGLLLTSLLNKKGFKVIGISNRAKIINGWNIEFYVYRQYIRERLDEKFISEIILKFKPQVIFHLASVHAPSALMNKDWENAKTESIYQVSVKNTNILLDGISRINPEIKFIFAGSSLMFETHDLNTRINENSLMSSSSIYARSKIEGFHLVSTYRNEHGLNCGTALLFNHESHFRQSGYLFYDIAKQIYEIMNHSRKLIELRNLSHIGDWHAAQDTVNALYLMTEKNYVDDYIIASGCPQSIGDIILNYLSSVEFNFLDQFRDQLINNYGDENGGTRVGDISKIIQIGWSPQIKLNKVIDDLINKISGHY